MLQSMQLGSLSAATAGRTAALTDVAATRRAHLGATGEAQRSVRRLALYQLQQLGRRTRLARRLLHRLVLVLVLDLVLDRRRRGHRRQLDRPVGRSARLR